MLNVLHGWLGEAVEVRVEVAEPPFTLGRMRGVLAGADGIATPEHDGEYGFALGTGREFALRRSHAPEGVLWPYAGRLEVAVIDDAATADTMDETVAARLVFSGPPLGAPPARG